MDELASVLVSYDSTGWLGNNFESQIIGKECMADIAQNVLTESGIDSLANLMDGYTWFGSEYVIYNTLGHFKDLTWGHCLNELEEVLSCIVSDHLKDLKDEYEVIL